MRNDIKNKLATATCLLLSQTLGLAQAQGDDITPPVSADWSVDSSVLSYVENDGRVAVRKSLLDLSRTQERGSMAVNIVHDTMSGASPTGAIRSNDSQVTFTGASGGSGFAAGSGSDYALSTFEDTRVQVGATLERQVSDAHRLSYGGVISQEQDYESFGATLGWKRELRDKLTTLDLGLGATFDTIYRSNSGDTPLPLGNTELSTTLGEATRNSYDALIGVTRVLNRRTLVQANVSWGVSQGYHSDPYKIISAADDNDRIIANFHDSRPESRQRIRAFTKWVHRLRDTDHTVRASYRLYRDDWGIQSHTLDGRYRHQLTERQYLEPHVRLYRQSAADFYQRKLGVSESLDPILPEDGLASADYRLDAMSSVTFGMKYGLAVTSALDLRFRGEYIARRFSDSEFSSNDAQIVQVSARYRF